MTIRPFDIASDAQLLADIIPKAFVYPNHPEWSIDDAETEELLSSVKSMQRSRWVIKFLRLFWKPAHDLWHGFVWEEDGQPVGLVNITPDGGNHKWTIGNVAVLPDYRRRGIAKKLVLKCIEYAKSRRAELITLAVIQGNTPAYKLYNTLGFEPYSAEIVYRRNSQPNIPDIALPTEYKLEPLALANWQLRYEINKKIVSPSIQNFEPVQRSTFEISKWIMPIQGASMKLLGMLLPAYTVYNQSKQPIGYVACRARRQENATQELILKLDPQHSHLIPALLSQMMREVTEDVSSKQFELHIPEWQLSVEQQDLSALGLKEMYRHHVMGMRLK